MKLCNEGDGKWKSDEIIRGWNVADGAEKVVFSAYIQAVKPAGKETL